MASDFEGETPKDRFQQATLQIYSDGDLAFEKELIESYKISISEHLPKLGESFTSDDVDGSILHSHDIKGSSSYIGAESVRFLSGKIEALCKQRNLTEAAIYLPELQKEVEEAFKLLDRYMATGEIPPSSTNEVKDDKEEMDKEEKAAKEEEAKEQAAKEEKDKAAKEKAAKEDKFVKEDKSVKNNLSPLTRVHTK